MQRVQRVVGHPGDAVRRARVGDLDAQGVLPRDVKFLLGVYGVNGEARELLLTLAREARQKGWWHSYGEAIPSWFEVYIGLEAEAVSVHSYESELVPGLLQTKEYARAVFRGFLVDAEEIDKRVELRMARQQRLTDSDAPQYWIVLNESVLRRVVGGPAAMRSQLSRLLEASQLPNVTLQVLPFAVGAHPAMDGSFVVLGFPEPTDPDVVYLEEQTGGLYLEKPHEIKRHTLAFDHLRAAALHPDESRRLIARSRRACGKSVTMDGKEVRDEPGPRPAPRRLAQEQPE